MKKNILIGILIILCVGLCIFLYKTKVVGSGSQDTSNNGSGNQKGGGFSKADLMGEVESVSGNSVKLKLLKIEQPSGGPNNQNSSSNPSDSQNTTDTNNTQEGNSGGRQQMQFTKEYTGEEKTITISDSTKIYTMSKPTSDDSQNTTNEDQSSGQGKRKGGFSRTEISASDIKTGDVLSITYDTDKTTIKEITVRSEN